MQVIYSNAAFAQANAGCPPQNRDALFSQIAQQAQGLGYVRNDPERYANETHTFAIPINDPRWQLLVANAYVSAMEKEGFFRRRYVGTQVMVVSFQ
ncbi:hypothetical protein [Bradyrhizobium sp. LTSP857]|uniref:hypothetical protein n=1 Tax=Bradyrhizobium sp. LTSP857 TaxID=1619231 RepID=UPI000A750D43|nr:hypothetical protein [Bradyrhizobium sp. LTSP857]